jgi:recombination protein RecA
MAKTKKTDEEVDDNNLGSIEDAFKVLDKMNENAAFLNENSLSTVNEWIDTGSYALNAIISGSLYGGIPMGRLTGFVGPESCGKTLMANKIMANAQKKGMYVAYFDTEGALDSNTATRLGCDAKKIKHIPSEITEQCRNEIVKFLDTVIQNKLQGKVLLVIDSLGNLMPAQEKKKIEEGSETPDLGARPKQLKSLMRAITHSAAKANCPVVFTNHIYEDPAQMYPTAIKKQAGGSGPLYMSSVIVQMAKKTEKVGDAKNKDANEESTFLSKGINGLTLRAFTTKNRFVPPFLEIEMYLNFKTGLNKYSGLLEMAEGYEVLTKQGHRYVLGEEMLGFYKDWKDDENIWQKILPVLEKKLQKTLAFKDESSENLLSEIDVEEEISE